MLDIEGFIGAPLPEWSLEPINTPVPTVESFRGKPLLILFIYLGCPGCKGRAIPFANRVVFEERGVNVVGIHTRFEGPDHTDEQLIEAMDEFYMRFPLFRDKGEAETWRKYHGLGTPHWILVDKDGIVVKSVFGSEPNNALLRLDLQLKEMLQ